MTRLLRISSIAIFATTCAVAVPALAAHSQQSRMTDCNAQAKTQNLSGEPRKTFMKGCLSGAAPQAQAQVQPQAQAPTQQDRMKSCNAEAGTKQLKGDERKAFMKSCLSSK